MINRNKIIYYLSNFFGKSGIIVPVLYLFLTDIWHFSPELALFAIGIRSASSSIFEIPTGVIADKVSRRISVISGYIVKSLGALSLLFTGNFLVAFLGMVLIGLGDSLTSGADKSLLFDTLKSEGKEKEYKNTIYTSKSIMFTQVAVSSILGGLLGDINLSIPIFLTFVSYFIGGLISFLFIEPKESKEGSEIEKEGYIAHTFTSFKNVFSKESFLHGIGFLVTGFIIIEMIGKANKNIIPPVFEELGADVVLIGIIVSATYLAKAIGAFLANRFGRDGNEENEIILGVGVYILSMASIIFFPNLIVGTIAFSIAIMMAPLIQTNLDHLLNMNIESKRRATIMSIVSLSQNLIALGFVTAVGVLISNYNSVIPVLLIKVILLILLIFSLILFRRNTKNSHH